MVMLPAEFLYSTRTLVESQLAGCNALMRTAFESGAGLLDVNIHAALASFEAANAASNQLLFVREAQDLLHLTASQSQQAIERAGRYGRQVAGVANDLHARLDALGKGFAGTLPHTSLE